MRKHKEMCDAGFVNVDNSKDCFFFIKNGGCLRGTSCRFKHPEIQEAPKAPACRNGRSCKYLASGVCSFFHAGVGIQQPRMNRYPQEIPEKQQRGWCKFLEECTRVPNCPFLHSDEDFPKLSQHNYPHIGARRMAGAWQDY